MPASGGGGRGVAAVAAPDAAHFAVGQFNLNAAAATYSLLTATGDVLVESVSAYVKTASGGLTSLTIQTDHTTPKSIVASILNAAVTIDLAMTIVTAAFVLPSGKKITGTIVGTGNAGLIYVVARWVPLTAGALLA